MQQTQLVRMGWRTFNVPMDRGVLRCEICRQDIASFDPLKLTAPVRPDMFDPIVPGMPHPFARQVVVPVANTWQYAACPYCRKRPFSQTDAVMTPNGIFRVSGELPRPVTPEQQAANARQAEIDRVWAEEVVDQEEDITIDFLRGMYPDKPQDELNQMFIESQDWPEEEARSVHGTEEEEARDMGAQVRKKKRWQIEEERKAKKRRK